VSGKIPGVLGGDLVFPELETMTDNELRRRHYMTEKSPKMVVMSVTTSSATTTVPRACW